MCRKSLRRKAGNCDIKHPFSYSREQVVVFISTNLTEQDRIQSHAPMLRELHLRSSIKRATESGDKKGAREIKAKVDREFVTKNWRITNHVLKPRGKEILHVETTAEDGAITSHDTKESLEEATMTCLSKRFSMAASSSFNQGQLIEDIGRDADRPAADAILAGTYCPPNGTDCHSRGLIRVIGRVAEKVGSRRTSSLFSGLDFSTH